MLVRERERYKEREEGRKREQIKVFYLISLSALKLELIVIKLTNMFIDIGATC